MSYSVGQRHGVAARNTAKPRIWLSYLTAFAAVAVATAIAFPMFEQRDLANIVLVYLLAVFLLAAALGTGPAALATVLAVACFVYFFRSLPTFALLLCVGLVFATLTGRLRAEAVAGREREIRSQALYQLSRGLAAAETRAAIIAVVREHVQEVFGCSSWLLECKRDGLVVVEPAGADPMLTPEVMAFAQRALRDRSVLRAEGLLFVPMIVASEPVGLVFCRGIDVRDVSSAAHLSLLEAFANNAAIALQRLIIGDEARETQHRIDAVRLRNVMLSSMSHDFRTPLASITGAVTTLIDSGASIDQETRTDLMHSIREDADHLEVQVRNMLDVTRLESGNLQVERDWHALEEVVGCALTRLERSLASRSIKIEIPPDLPMVAMDALLIEQMLVNLLENAARYTPPGSPIEITAQDNDEWIRIAIADHGPGIPAAEREAVFKKFYRGASAKVRGGSGLGLAICRAIAQLHGGFVWVDDRPDGAAGAAFQIDLPSQWENQQVSAQAMRANPEDVE
ncbi:MAG TPA: ATP-binding protein [Planctomycetota bacterium]|nr:ATP-binding protein [Planctomycetota bacterium]